MNWNEVEGKWKEMKGTVRAKFGKLTDDDLNVIGGKKDQLIGKIQQRYGITREQAERDLEVFLKGLPETTQRTHTSGGGL